MDEINVADGMEAIGERQGNAARAAIKHLMKTTQ